MAYKHGMLQTMEVVASEDDLRVDYCDVIPEGCMQAGEGKAGEHIAYLPHSCDRWVIGGIQEVKCLIDDLQALLFHYQTIEKRDRSET